MRDGRFSSASRSLKPTDLLTYIVSGPSDDSVQYCLSRSFGTQGYVFVLSFLRVVDGTEVDERFQQLEYRFYNDPRQ
jgi:hypothetical protein